MTQKSVMDGAPIVVLCRGKAKAGPSLLLHPSDEDLSPGTPGLKNDYGQNDGHSWGVVSQQSERKILGFRINNLENSFGNMYFTQLAQNKQKIA
jgi:hypothetical protein